MKRYIASLILILCIGLLSPMALFGQKAQTVTAIVADEEGNGIAGVSVIGDEGSVVTMTDAGGNFTITVSLTDMLLFEAYGYYNKQMAISKVIDDGNVTLAKAPYHMDEEDLIAVPFGKLEKRRVTGAVTNLKVDDILLNDNRNGVEGAINGRVPGVFGNKDVRGLGNALIVVDGVPRSASELDIDEIEEITILRDIASRALYGALANQAVVLVNTKRGQANKKTLKASVEVGMNSPISYPEFLNSAEYMEAYNEASMNDGGDKVYSDSLINLYRSGQDPVRYPDEDYYNSTYLRDVTNFTKFKVNASGGNENAQYAAHVGWQHDQGWFALGQENFTDKINVRGNVDYKVSDFIKASLDAAVIFDLKTGPDNEDYNKDKNNEYDDFWVKSSTYRPNLFPVLIPYKDYEDYSVVNESKTINEEYALGKSFTFDNVENLYGEMTQLGRRFQMKRTIFLNTGLDFDLGFLTEGLSAKAYLSFDMFSTYADHAGKNYAAYEVQYAKVLDLTTTEDTLDLRDSSFVNQVQAFKPSDGRAIFGGSNNNESDNDILYFNRNIGFYGQLAYDRTFGVHDINATAVYYGDYFQEEKQLQVAKTMHTAVRANYMYNNKYVVDVTGTYSGSQKLSDDNKYAFSPTVGLAWVVSEEGFLSGSSAIDYLKIRGSFGMLYSDKFKDDYSDYFYYKTTYNEADGWFTYNNNQGSRSKQININQLANPDLTFMKRSEFNIGLDAALLNNTLWIDLGYFRSTLSDQLTKMEYTYGGSAYGYIDYWDNYNENQVSGVELGLEYRNSFSNIDLTLGTNMLVSNSTATVKEEPFYDDDEAHRRKEGKDGDAIFGLEADGLYSEADITAIANGTLPKPTWEVQAGDIKYIDQNDDKIIDIADETKIGNNKPSLTYSMYISLKAYGFELFALGTGETGKDVYYGESKFWKNEVAKDRYYWVYGDRKYSTVVNDRYSPDNKDVNASYPRLGVAKSANNFQNSSYWLYSNDFFKIHTVQLNYNVSTQTVGFLNGLKVYVRGNNLLTVGENAERMELNIGKAPQLRSYALGVVASF